MPETQNSATEFTGYVTQLPCLQPEEKLVTLLFHSNGLQFSVPATVSVLLGQPSTALKPSQCRQGQHKTGTYLTQVQHSKCCPTHNQYLLQCTGPESSSGATAGRAVQHCQS